MIRTFGASLLALFVTLTTASLVWRWWWVDDDLTTQGRQPRLDLAESPADDLGFSAALVAARVIAALWIVRELCRRADEVSWLRLAVFTACCVIPLQVVALGLSAAG